MRNHLHLHLCLCPQNRTKQVCVQFFILPQIGTISFNVNKSSLTFTNGRRKSRCCYFRIWNRWNDGRYTDLLLNRLLITIIFISRYHCSNTIGLLANLYELHLDLSCSVILNKILVRNKLFIKHTVYLISFFMIVI